MDKMTTMTKEQVDTLRGLGRRYAQIAALDCQQQTIDAWRRLNGLQHTRPMVMLDQLPWHELPWGEDDCVCPDGLFRQTEVYLRQTLYAWEHFRADMVVLPHIPVPRHLENAELGPELRIESLGISKRYGEQLKSIDEVRALKTPVIATDPERDRRRQEMLSKIFDGIVPVVLTGQVRHSGLWDRITSLISPARLLYDLVDRPDFVAELIARFVEMEHGVLDQLEAAGALEAAPPLIHCTGAFCDELPSADHGGGKAMARDTWTFSMAQMFSDVSPAMQEQFDIIPLAPLLERYGLVYYGCCEPLHDKIDIVRRIGNVRKISVSPWADKEKAAERIHGDYVFSAKPNPAFVAMDRFDADLVRRDLEETVAVCRRHQTPCELILKDVSTVLNDPPRLEAWEAIAMEVVRA
ncbi:MAG: hypothetical protein CMJ18_17030 [Phycisphaeraceae bacterium]|nr:hypothetical protein [Phycisphaeraceae bacterium]